MSSFAPQNSLVPHNQLSPTIHVGVYENPLSLMLAMVEDRGGVYVAAIQIVCTAGAIRGHGGMSGFRVHVIRVFSKMLAKLDLPLDDHKQALATLVKSLSLAELTP